MKDSRVKEISIVGFDSGVWPQVKRAGTVGFIVSI